MWGFINIILGIGSHFFINKKINKKWVLKKMGIGNKCQLEIYEGDIPKAWGLLYLISTRYSYYISIYESKILKIFMSEKNGEISCIAIHGP